jgi:hypothetical protein
MHVVVGSALDSYILPRSPPEQRKPSTEESSNNQDSQPSDFPARPQAS